MERKSRQIKREREREISSGGKEAEGKRRKLNKRERGREGGVVLSSESSTTGEIRREARLQVV